MAITSGSPGGGDTTGMEITKVQEWVATVLLGIMGMISATCMAGYSVLSETLAENGNAVALWAMSAVVGVLTIAGCLLIHKRSPLSPWLLVGVLPATVSGFFVF